VSDTRQVDTYSLLLQAKDLVGHSVLTSFNYLNEIGLNVGGTVEKGWRIGLMEETGQVPGSHLHLGMVVHGVTADTEKWTAWNFSATKGGGNLRLSL